MPRQLTKRGHRLVFSNGIIFLAVAAIVLLIVTDAKVDRLIPLYAIGVFTIVHAVAGRHGQAPHPQKEPGLALGAVRQRRRRGPVARRRRHHRDHEVHARRLGHHRVRADHGGRPACASNRQYEREDEALEHDVPQAVAAPVLRRLVVMVFVDRLDLAVARAMQFARTLTPDELRAVHFVLDPITTEELAAAWRELGFARLRSSIIDCPDRRISTRPRSRSSAEALADGEHRGVRAPSPHPAQPHSGTASCTTAPRTRSRKPSPTAPQQRHDRPVPPRAGGVDAAKRSPWPPARTDGNGNGIGQAMIRATTVARCHPTASRSARSRCAVGVTVAGRVHAVRVQPWGGAPSLEATIKDGTGELTLVFLGRREVGGVRPGAVIKAEGVVGTHRHRAAILNPAYVLLSTPNPTAHH